jgi:hypothetical protein
MDHRNAAVSSRAERSPETEGIFDMNTRAEEVRARMDSDKSSAFDRWMSEPLVRMSINMIPASEHKDALQMLLRSAFDAGHGAGQGAMAGTFLKAMMAKDKPPR